jgi:transposase-like protein
MPCNYPPEMRRQIVELARPGKKVKQLAATFQISDATIYKWLKPERVDRGEAEGQTTSARRRSQGCIGHSVFEICELIAVAKADRALLIAGRPETHAWVARRYPGPSP